MDACNKNVYPHVGCGGWWQECPACEFGWICSGCKKHDNENDPLDHECKNDRRVVV